MKVAKNFSKTAGFGVCSHLVKLQLSIPETEDLLHIEYMFSKQN